MIALIIEDESSFRECIRVILAPFGITFLEAETLGRGIELAVEHRDIDLIMLDLRLPDSPAETTIKHIPKFKQMHPTASLLVMTGMAGDELREQSFVNGADHFATKDTITNTGAMAAAVLKSFEHNRRLNVDERLSKSIALLRTTAAKAIEND